MTDDELKYWAFLSYSQADNQEQRPDKQDFRHLRWGDWLHEALKTFSVPTEFTGHLNSRGEMTPERIQPIFQDEQEGPGDAGLSADVRKALEQSRCLVVICSPRSAKSLHVNESVRYFKQLGRGKNIFPIVIAGEPNVGEGNPPGKSPDDECLVPALRHPLRPDGTLDTGRRPGKYIVVDARHGAGKREILADDHRNAEADLETAKIQLIALLAGVAFNGLWWREQKRHFVDLADARQQAREALNQVTEAQRQLQEAERQTREAQNRILEVQNLPGDVQGQIQEAQTKALEAQNQTREAQRQLQEFQTKSRDTQDQLEEARSRVLAVENKCLEAQNQARESQRQVEETQRQLQEARNQVQLQAQTVSGEIQEAQRQAEEARRLIQELQSQAQQAQAQAQEARGQAEAANRQLQEARSQAQVPAVPAENAEAQRQAEEARRLIQELQDRTRQAQTQVQEAKSEADTAQSKIQAAQNQILQARRLTNTLALVTLIALLVAGIAWWQRKNASQPLASSAPPEPKESDLTPVKMDSEQIRQALQKCSAVQPGTNQLQRLDDLATRIPLDEIPETLKTSSLVLDDPSRSYFQFSVLDHSLPALVASNPTNTLALLNELKPVPVEDNYILLFQHWATNNPMQAIEQRQQVPDHDADDKILLTIVSAWVGQQPDAALDWVKAQSDSDSKNKALEACVWKLAETDDTKALMLAESLPEGTWRSTIIARLFNDWSAKDLDAATTAYQQLPNGMAKAAAWESILSERIAKDPAAAAGDVTNLPAGDYRQIALEELCVRWADTNTPAALAWAQSLPSASEQTNAVNQVVTDWACKDPQAASQYASQHPELSGDALGGIAEALAKSDLTAATNWVASVTDAGKKDAALLGVSGTWVQTDPKGMATFALTLPTGDVQTQYLTTACRQLAIHDLPGTVELLKPLSDDGLRQNLLKQAGQTCDLPHMDQAAKYIATMAAGDDQKAVIQGLLSSWTPTDPEAAINWLCAFPENNPQTNEVQFVIKAWAQTAPAAAARWLANAPAATNDDGTVAAFLASVVEKYPEFAGQWTESVTNQASRQKYQVQVARQWMTTDPAAATNWLKSLDLPAELKQLK